MSDEEDDYLSDKFLLASAAAPTRPKTYAERRKEAQKLAQIKNEENRHKSRRQIELESREEGLSKSLFERAKEEEEMGISSGNKALSMMMKMGFKPGQALGKLDEPKTTVSGAGLGASSSASTPDPADSATKEDVETKEEAPKLKHKIEPIPINEWMGMFYLLRFAPGHGYNAMDTGTQGIGVRKRPRAPSPTSAERVAKMAKMAEVTSQETYRDRTRQEYEERRAEGRLGPVQRTCTSLDEKAGKTFNVLWLNPLDPGSFPQGLMEALTERAVPVAAERGLSRTTLQARMRQQMQADALRPLNTALDEDPPSELLSKEIFTPETVDEAAQFLRLNARNRLQLVVTYLRDKYAYCFWCGTQYEDLEEMDVECPGPEEDAHD
ncbi:hypothetical protein HWV62_40519 [Athelia sp. TMB]|nr:hypothetical protein HWV62_40519 [Athelia sp. TMB]